MSLWFVRGRVECAKRAPCGRAQRSLSRATCKAMPKRARKKQSKAPRSRGGDAAGFERAAERVAQALERLAPPKTLLPDFADAEAFAWHPDGRLLPVRNVNRVDMALLKGIDRVRDMLVENTERFARGLPANNALLWGARGMGKSSLVKAAHAAVNAAHAGGKRGRGLLKLV